MKLRDHPLMSYRGVSNWPPVWVKARTNGRITVKGEVGVLIYVHSNAELSTRCYLVIDYENDTYVGTLIFGDRAFCKQITDILNMHLKCSIKAIGDLDLSHTI